MMIEKFAGHKTQKKKQQPTTTLNAWLRWNSAQKQTNKQIYNEKKTFHLEFNDFASERVADHTK